MLLKTSLTIDTVYVCVAAVFVATYIFFSVVLFQMEWCGSVAFLHASNMKKARITK